MPRYARARERALFRYVRIADAAISVAVRTSRRASSSSSSSRCGRGCTRRRARGGPCRGTTSRLPSRRRTSSIFWCVASESASSAGRSRAPNSHASHAVPRAARHRSERRGQGQHASRSWHIRRIPGRLRGDEWGPECVRAGDATDSLWRAVRVRGLGRAAGKEVNATHVDMQGHGRGPRRIASLARSLARSLFAPANVPFVVACLLCTCCLIGRAQFI